MFSLFAPLFALGASLIAIPWLIHLIQRPRLKTAPFSSLMFVPKVKPKPREKRRLHNILLMLMRMAMLLLLAFAFARPYQEVESGTTEAMSASRQMILLDNSYSMSFDGAFERARAQALDLVGRAGADDRIGLIVFNQAVELSESPIMANESPAENRDRIRAALQTIEPSQKATRYGPALKRAQELLLQGGEEDGEEITLTAHVISDFQANGFSLEGDDGRLSSGIECVLHRAHSFDGVNASIRDVYLRERADGSLRVLAQVKNESDRVIDELSATLAFDDGETETRSIRLESGQTRNVIFDAKLDRLNAHAGRIALDDDALALDHQRYFAWNPQQDVRIVLSNDDEAERRWPSSWFLERALTLESAGGWTLETNAAIDMLDDLDSNGLKPDIVILTSQRHVETIGADDLVAYINQGGRLMLWLDPAHDWDAEADSLISRLGLNHSGTRFDSLRSDQYEPLAWADFASPVFYPLREMQFNDLTSIHAYNFVRLASGINAETGIFPLAKFRGDSPALIFVESGEGNALIWTTSPALEVSNLSKSSKFIPILFESIGFLKESAPANQEFSVGETMTKPLAVVDGEWNIRHTENDQFTWPDSGQAVFDEAGLLSFVSQNESIEFAFPVNINADESNAETLSDDEWIRRAGSLDQIRERQLAAVGAASPLSDEAAPQEWGLWLIAALLALYIAESLWATLESRREHRQSMADEGSEAA